MNEALVHITRNIGNVEKVNDTAAGAPSKRIIQLIPQYEKLTRTVGPDAVAEIGMIRLLENCRHFASWIADLQTRLGSL